MGEREPFFVVRQGNVWACWLSGQPAQKLGPVGDVTQAMSEFLAETGATPASTPASSPPPASAPAPTPVPPPAPQAEERRAPVERGAPRHELTIVGKVYTGTGSWEVTILDLSESGCMIVDPKWSLREGALVSIKIGTIGPVAASVRWHRERRVGLQFADALHPSVLDHICREFDLRR